MIAEKIKALREARSWTQAELARRMGITRNGVNSWEQGLSTPSLGIEPLASINVTGLDEKDVAALAMLADRLRATKE